MSEFKRVFLDRSRLLALGLLTFLCSALLVFSLIGSIEPGALKNNTEAKNYAVSLIDGCKDMPAEEITKLLLSENERLAYISYWINGARSEWYGFQSEEEYRSVISSYPYLQSISDNSEQFNRAYFAYSRWLSMVKTEAEHQAGYKDYLQGISEQSQKLSQIAIFGNANSFSNRNIIKTAKEFSRLGGTETVFGNNLGLELWLSFSISDYLFVGGILLIVLAFFEERKKGLWSVIRSCPDGRLKLGASRLSILFAGSVICTMLFCVLPLVISLGFTGGWSELGRALQSLASFKTSTLTVTISSWLIRYFIIKIVSGIAIGLVIWCILGTVTNPQFSLSVLGLIFAFEYALYELLPVQSFANIIKYFNIFSYVHLSGLYTSYLNINLFGQPVGVRAMMLYALPILLILLTAWALCIQAKRYPAGNRDILGILSVKKNAVLDIFRTRLTMGGWEMYKAFVFSFGIVIAVVILILGGSLNYSVYINEPDHWYQAYLTDAQGKSAEEAAEYFKLARKNAGDNSELLSALDRLEREVSETKERAKERGFEPRIVDEKVYASHYGTQAVDKQRLNALIAIVFVVFLTAGIGAYERQSGVTFMVRSTKNGRGGLLARKAVTSAVMAAMVWANVYMRELIVFLSRQKPVTLGAQVQNLTALAGFPLKITLWQYLALLYTMRLFMLVLTGFIVLAIGGLCRNILMSYILNIGVLAFPGLLDVSGVEVMRYASPVIAVSSAEILWNTGSVGSSGLIYYAIVTAVVIMVGMVGSEIRVN